MTDRTAARRRPSAIDSAADSSITWGKMAPLRKEPTMRVFSLRGWLLPMFVLATLGLRPPALDSACCYFSAKDKDINQPAQKVFITWDPVEKVESFTVQPKFEGNALDFGMVIPTPARPKLDEMPRDFFKELAVFTILKKREFPQSKLVPNYGRATKGAKMNALANYSGPRKLDHPISY